MKHRPTYKELMMRRDAFIELRNQLDILLNTDEVAPSKEIEFDEGTGDILVTRIYAGIERTHRIAITEETGNVPRETSPETLVHEHVYRTAASWPSGPMEHDCLQICACGDQVIVGEIPDVPRETSPDFIELHVDMPVSVIAMLQLTINVAWRQYGGDPNNPEQFWNHLVGNGAEDVPRETSTYQVDVVYRVNGGAVRTAQRTVEAEHWTHAVEQVREFITSALPRDKVEFGNFSGGVIADGGLVATDVPRETSQEDQ